MCEIFSAIGASILGSIGITGASSAAATAVGAAATAASVGSMTATGLGIANNARMAHSNQSQAKSMQRALTSPRQNNLSEKTASQLGDNRNPRRAISSLRIPLDKTTNTSNTEQINTTSTNTGLNIPL